MINLNQYLTGASPYDSSYVLKYRDGEYSLETDPPLVPYTSKDKQHTIKEGETLTRVSLRFYGTKAMWPYIVKHNPKVIKNPNNVPYGTTIEIPELTKE